MTTTIHHPSCPQRGWSQDYLDALGSKAAACLCGPEAQEEDRLILMSRSTDAMVLDIVSHADRAADHGLTADGPVGRRILRQLGMVF
jgi:hypothetical protein